MHVCTWSVITVASKLISRHVLRNSLTAVQELTDSSTYTQLHDNKLGRPYWVDLTLYITVGNLPQGSSLVYLSEATRWVQQLLRNYSSYEHYTVLYPTRFNEQPDNGSIYPIHTDTLMSLQKENNIVSDHRSGSVSLSRSKDVWQMIQGVSTNHKCLCTKTGVATLCPRVQNLMSTWQNIAITLSKWKLNHLTMHITPRTYLRIVYTCGKSRDAQKSKLAA